MSEKNRFGINLLCLLRFHNISQSRLTEDLDINKSLISRYISGKIQPSSDNLQKLAAYFNIAPEALLKGDLSDLPKQANDGKDFYRKLNEMLPVFQTEKCMHNPHFRKAYEAHYSLFKRWSALDFRLDGIDTEMIFAEYREAINDEDIQFEATANLLSMQFLSFASMRDLALSVADQDSMPLAAREQIEENEKLRNHILSNQDEFEYDAREYWRLIREPEFQEQMLDHYCLLKSNSEWSGLADYYIGLQFYLGAVHNPFSFVQNREIGSELLAIQACCDNPYAERFFLLMAQETD